MHHSSVKEEVTLSQMLCRICATQQQQDDDSSMNNLLTSNHNGLYFVDMLQDCLQRTIPRDNGFPLNICFACTSNLIAAYNFRLMCDASEQKLTEMLGYNWKSEIGLKREIDEPECDVKTNFLIDCTTFDLSVLPLTCDAGPATRETDETRTKLNKRKVQRYECYQCKTMFKRIALLRKHMKNDHFTADKRWSCSDCHKRYSLRKRLVQHFHKHISRECDNCNESITTLRDMQKHYEQFHADSLVPHRCERCPKNFVLKDQLRIHQLDHLNKHHKRQTFAKQSDGQIQTPHSTCLCSECGKTFKNKWLLKSHQNIHSSAKQFVCSKCPSRFKWKLAFTYHMTIHQRDERQKHVCETCGASFATRSSMKAHTKIHSGVRAYACDKCPKQFLRRDHLTRHYLGHTGEKPYVCKYCDKGFRQCAQLNTHQRVHVGENTYECDLCLKKFKLKAEMMKHECEHYDNLDVS